MGVEVTEIIVSQITVQDDSFEYRNLPCPSAFDWYTERIAEGPAVLDDLDAAIGDLRSWCSCRTYRGEPIGPKALAELIEASRRRRRISAARPARPIVDRGVGFGTRSIVYRLRPG